VTQLYLGLAATVLSLVAAYFLSAPFRVSTLVWAGRGQGCSLEKSLAAGRDMAEQEAVKNRLLAASKMVEQDGGLLRYTTPQGDYWIPEKSKYSLFWNLAEMERRIYGAGQNAVRQGDVVLDCGANVGSFARLALKDGAAKVIAIEPAPENLECLRRAFPKEIADGRLVLYPKGVWHKEDMLLMNVDPGNSAADSFVLQQKDAKPSAVKLPLTTIDKLVAELGLDRVDFIKMDIEGAETNALRGGRETIKRFKPRMSLSTYHLPTDPKDVPAIVASIRADYTIESGPCAEIPGALRPDILYFK
jgi:FkbM family methyltransferase